MRPILFSLHFGHYDVSPHTYGFLIALGFLVGVWLAVRNARRDGVDPGHVLDLCFWMLIAGLVGARILYIATTASDYWNACFDGAGRSFGHVVWDCTRVLHVWEGGLVFYGGFAGAALALVLYVRRHHMDFFRTADTIIPSLALGHFFGRLGCFSAGCCFGQVCPDLPWGVRFPIGSLAYSELITVSRGLTTPPLHPTQMYEAAGELGLFFILCGLRRRKRYDGQLFLVWLTAYPVLRSIVEMFRGDVIRKFVVEIETPRLAHLLGLAPDRVVLLSTSQFLSLIVMGAAIGVAVHLRRRAQRLAAAVPAA